jgi:hypothetical protein
MLAMQVLNTRGAARRLGCSQNWIHRLVSAGKLKAYTYDDNGMLVERTPDDKRQGQGLYFFAEDVDMLRTTPRHMMLERGAHSHWAKKLVSSPRLREDLFPFLGMGADCRKRRARSEKFFSKGTGKIGRRKHPFMLWRWYGKR